MAEDLLNAHFRVRDLGSDAEGHAIVRLSFVDMAALTERVTAWVTHAVAAIEAAGVHVEVGPDEALAMFVAGVSAEDAAMQMIAASRAATASQRMHPAPIDADDAHRPEAWEGTSLSCHLRSWPAAPPDTDAFSAAYAGGLMQQAADEIDRLTAEVRRVQVDRAEQAIKIARKSALIDAAWDLLRACESDMSSDDIENGVENGGDDDDEPVGGGEGGPTAVQFGHMRRLRKALAELGAT